MWKNVSVNLISRRRVSKRFQGISFSRIISFIPVNITKQDFSNAFRNIISAKYSIPKITKSRNVIHTKIYPLKENWLNFFRAVHNNDSTIMIWNSLQVYPILYNDYYSSRNYRSFRNWEFFAESFPGQITTLWD